MKKLFQLICIVAIPLLFTQCKSQDPELAPGPEPPVPVQPISVQGIFRMTYDDYRILKYGTALGFDLVTYVRKYYQGLTRTVTATTDGDRLNIKGMFPEYPDASFKGVIRGDTIYFEPTQRLEGTGGKPVYVHTGYAEYEWPHTTESVTQQISFRPDKRELFIEVGDNGEVNSLDIWRGLLFWLSDDEEGSESFYSVWRNGRVSGTGFPEAPNHFVNVSFERIGD